MTPKSAILCAILTTVVLLAACGQKGPLFLPDAPSTLSTPPPGPQAAPDADTEEEEETAPGEDTGEPGENDN